MTRMPSLLAVLSALALATMGAGPLDTPAPVVPEINGQPINLKLVPVPLVQPDELLQRLEAIHHSNANGTMTANVDGREITVAPSSADSDSRLVLDSEPVQLRILAKDSDSDTTIVLVLDGLGRQWKFGGAMVIERDGTTYTATGGTVSAAEVSRDAYEGTFSFTARHGSTSITVSDGRFALGMDR